MKIHKNRVYKIRKWIRNEKILYFYSDINLSAFNGKKDFYESSSVIPGFDIYNLQNSSTKKLLEETLFKNYGFLIKDSLYVIRPSVFLDIKSLEKVLAKATFLCLKLNNNLYLKNIFFTQHLSFIYQKEVLSFTCLLYKCLKSISSFHRNDVN